MFMPQRNELIEILNIYKLASIQPKNGPNQILKKKSSQDYLNQ